MTKNFFITLHSAIYPNNRRFINARQLEVYGASALISEDNTKSLIQMTHNGQLKYKDKFYSKMEITSNSDTTLSASSRPNNYKSYRKAVLFAGTKKSTLPKPTINATSITIEKHLTTLTHTNNQNLPDTWCTPMAKKSESFIITAH